jgi:4-hydroxy-tetrahydrodipicolinate reductase
MRMRFVSYGLGYIGRTIAKIAIDRGLEMVGGIDKDPRLIGKDLETVIGAEVAPSIRVSASPEEILRETTPDIVFHATGSFLDKVFNEIMLSVDAGARVVSTCETLCYPYYRYPRLAEEIDEAAKAKGVNVLGTGINPGFIMDLLPAVMTTCVMKLEKLSVVRCLDASKRRQSFQKKIGLGLTLDEFKSKLASGEITSHVGLSESVLLISSMLSLGIEEVREEQTPILAEEEIRLSSTAIGKERVRGVVAVGAGSKQGKELIRLEFVALVGIQGQEYEEIRIEGAPSVTWRSSGTAGDLATGAVVVNTALHLPNVRAGLLTMKDLTQTTYLLASIS